jgi:hypothetical protein
VAGVWNYRVQQAKGKYFGRINFTDALQLMLASIYEEPYEKKMEIELSV